MLDIFEMNLDFYRGRGCFQSEIIAEAMLFFVNPVKLARNSVYAMAEQEKSVRFYKKIWQMS